MKKFILIAAVVFTVAGLSYGIAASVNSSGVTAQAACDENSCN